MHDFRFNLSLFLQFSQNELKNDTLKMASIIFITNDFRGFPKILYSFFLEPDNAKLKNEVIYKIITN